MQKILNANKDQAIINRMETVGIRIRITKTANEQREAAGLQV